MQSIVDVIVDVCSEMCDRYCKYPEEAKKAGRDENWLTESDDSPCNNCPLNRLA